ANEGDTVTVQATLPNLAELAPILAELPQSKPKKEKFKEKDKVKEKDDDKDGDKQVQLDHFKQIAIAFHAHNDTYKKLPKVKSGLSWRVALLPYLDEIDLYKEFK